MKNIFPVSVNPPKLVKPYGPQLGYVAAAVMVIFAVLHLFRIDTFLPVLDKVLPRGIGTAAWFAIGVILTEVFSIPFLLRMKLSPLAHIVSGFLAVIPPLLWTLLTIWTIGLKDSTGQLGEFVSTPSTILLLALNALWLVFTFITLWALGYNNLKIKEVLKSVPARKKASS